MDVVDVEKMVVVCVFITIIGLFGVAFNAIENINKCKMKAFEKGMPAIEIQAICK